MPVTTPGIKIDAVRRLGAAVEMVGESYSETQTYAQVSLCSAPDNNSAPYAGSKERTKQALVR
jgi:threonine dehydratase